MGNVFNRYGAGGGKSEGVYIWKKREMGYKAVIEERYGTYTFDYGGANICYQSTSYTIDDEGNFQLTDPTVTPHAGVSTTVWYLVANTYYIFGSPTGPLMIRGTSSSSMYPTYASWVNDGAQISLTLSNSDYKFGLFTTTPTPTDLVGYLVSDDSSAYPDKETKDGYYYEKMSLSPSAWGCTKYQAGSFTLAGSVYYTNVTNTLGVVPKFAFLWSNNTDGTKWQAITYTENGNGTFGALWGSSNNGIYYDGGSATTTTVRFETRSNSTAYYYKAGTFNYIVLG